MFSCTKFKKVMDHSGLTKQELVSLYGVSRQSLYLWRERAPHQVILAERAEKYTDALLAAMDRGVLPFTHYGETTPARRAEFLTKMAQRLHALTAPR